MFIEDFFYFISVAEKILYIFETINFETDILKFKLAKIGKI